MVWRYVDPDKGNSLTGVHSTMGKCSSDSARHRGRRRNGNECFGACGQKDSPWNFTSADMKWYLDWLFVRGVNLIIPHAFYYSLRDDRVNERPPDVGPNSIWWNHYDQIVSYIKRMCWLNTDSRNVTDIAVLCSSDYLPWESVQPLYENQLEFNYLEAELLENCYLENGALSIGQQRYRVILAERDLFLTKEQKQALTALEYSGFPVVYVDSHRSGDDRRLVKQLAEYNSMALKTLQPIKDLRVSHVTKEGRHFYIMTNEGNDVLYFHASTALEGKLEIWNPWDGSMVPVAPDDMIPLHLGYRESRILVVTPTKSRPVPWQMEELVRTEALSSQTRRFSAKITVGEHENYTRAEVQHLGEIAVLYVDDVKIAAKMWPPYRFLLGDTLSAGTHKVTVEVTDAMVPDEVRRPPRLVLT